MVKKCKTRWRCGRGNVAAAAVRIGKRKWRRLAAVVRIGTGGSA